MNSGFLGPAIATVLTACGIETEDAYVVSESFARIATVLTACGIETSVTLPQMTFLVIVLQQYLPLAVLKLISISINSSLNIATVLTACGIETENVRSFAS